VRGITFNGLGADWAHGLRQTNEPRWYVPAICHAVFRRLEGRLELLVEEKAGILDHLTFFREDGQLCRHPPICRRLVLSA
jgi:hypothetical protein